MLADRRRELVERRLFEDETRLFGVWFDVVDRDDANTDRPSRAVGRQQADDGRRKLGVLGQPARRLLRGNQFGPRSITSRASSRYVLAASLLPAYVVIGRPTSGASPSFTVTRTMLLKTW